MRPTFNVTEFQGVVNVQMNDSMRDLLIEVLDDIMNDDAEIELRAFRNALCHPRGKLPASVRNRRPEFAG